MPTAFAPLTSSSDADRADVAHDTEHAQQPDHDHNHDHHIQDILDLAIHRHLGVHRPKRDAADDKCKEQIK